jgi:hypothetical protein
MRTAKPALHGLILSLALTCCFVAGVMSGPPPEPLGAMDPLDVGPPALDARLAQPELVAPEYSEPLPGAWVSGAWASPALWPVPLVSVRPIKVAGTLPRSFPRQSRTRQSQKNVTPWGARNHALRTARTAFKRTAFKRTASLPLTRPARSQLSQRRELLFKPSGSTG